MNINDTKRIVQSLADRASVANDAREAMQLAQAAVSVANAYETLVSAQNQSAK